MRSSCTSVSGTLYVATVGRVVGSPIARRLIFCAAITYRSRSVGETRKDIRNVASVSAWGYNPAS